MSTFAEDFQRRLRAVLAEKAGREIPPEIEVRVEVDSSGSDDDSRGVDRYLRLETVVPPDAEKRWWKTVGARYEYDEPGAFARLIADLDAVGMPRSGEAKTALDVVGPLSGYESSLLRRIYVEGPQRSSGDAEISRLQSRLAERGLIFLSSEQTWRLTALGRDAAAEIVSAPPAESPRITLVRVEKHGAPPSSSMTLWSGWDELGACYRLQFANGIGVVRAAVGSRPWPELRRFQQGTSNRITLEAFAVFAGIDISQVPEKDYR
jgi:hypothetical protein